MPGLNFTTAVWFLGPATLNAGQSVEFVIVYPGGGQVTSFNAIQTDTALNQRFSRSLLGPQGAGQHHSGHP
jgi:hypothetical protein